MNKLIKYIGSQFGKPRGIVGMICCFFMNRINQKMYRSIVVRLTDEKRILDIGYGNGFLVQKMYQKTGAVIEGIDISNDMQIAATKRNATGVEQGDIHLTIGDCCNLQYSDETFDVVSTVKRFTFGRIPSRD